MTRTFFAFAAAAELCIVVHGTIGIDVSVAVSESTWSCMETEGVDFMIARIYRSSGEVDTNGAATISAARQAGINYTDAYLFPCYSCGDAAGQVQDAVSSLSDVDFGMLWYDIENYEWSSSESSNQAFIQELIDEGLALGVTAGVYSSYYAWEEIVGLDWSYASDAGLPLWYAHYDDLESFSDFTAFGGWTTPSIKQFAGDVTLCSTDADENWYPSSSFYAATLAKAKHDQVQFSLSNPNITSTTTA